MIIKWSKTIQNRADIHTIPIPKLGISLICPYQALQILLQASSGHLNEPLFVIPMCHGAVPLTDYVARSHLHSVSRILKVPNL